MCVPVIGLDPVAWLSHKRLANTYVLMIPFALTVTLGIIPLVRLVYDSIDHGKVSSPLVPYPFNHCRRLELSSGRTRTD